MLLSLYRPDHQGLAVALREHARNAAAGVNAALTEAAKKDQARIDMVEATRARLLKHNGKRYV